MIHSANSQTKICDNPSAKLKALILLRLIYFINVYLITAVGGVSVMQC